jgi:hypothetical protein
VTHSRIIQGIENLDDFGKEHAARLEPGRANQPPNIRSPACARRQRQMSESTPPSPGVAVGQSRDPALRPVLEASAEKHGERLYLSVEASL